MKRLEVIAYLALALALVALSNTPTAVQGQRELDLLTIAVLQEFEKLDVDYFIIAGTLLGAHQIGRIQLHDYDTDVHVHYDSIDRIRRHDWAAVGLLVYEGFGGFRFKQGVFSQLRMDALVQRPCEEDQKLHFVWRHLDKMYPKAVLPVDWVYPVSRLNVRFFKARAPRKTARVLKRMYGNFTLDPPNGLGERVKSFWERQLWTRLIPLASLLSHDTLRTQDEKTIL